MKQNLVFKIVTYLLFAGLSCVLSLTSIDLAKADTSHSIGLILPLSGPRASIGDDARKGAELALREIKENAPEDYEKLHLLYEDSQGDPRVGISAYKSLVAQGVKFIVTQNSNVSLPISMTVNRDQVLQLAITTTSDTYKRKNDLTFRLNASTDIEADAMAEFLKNREDVSEGSIGIVSLEDEYPLSLAENLKESLRKKGLKIAFYEAVLKDEVDYKSLISRLKKAGVSHLAILAYAHQTGVLVRQIRDQQLSLQTIIGNAPTNRVEFFSAAGEAAVGVYCLDISINSEHPAFEKYLQEYDEVPNFFSSNGYDVVKVAYAALKECEFQYHPECLKTALFGIKNYDGLSGRKSFDNEFGDMQDYYKVMRANIFQFLPV